MTDFSNVQVYPDPLIQVVFRSGDEVTCSFSEIAFQGDNPATISDSDLISRISSHVDRPLADFNNLVVERRTTGNILVSPKAVYGG